MLQCLVLGIFSRHKYTRGNDFGSKYAILPFRSSYRPHRRSGGAQQRPRDRPHVPHGHLRGGAAGAFVDGSSRCPRDGGGCRPALPTLATARPRSPTGPCGPGARGTSAQRTNTRSTVSGGSEAARQGRAAAAVVNPSPPPTAEIPFFVLLPRRAEAINLLVPLTPSSTHVTFASLRVEPQFMVMGQAVREEWAEVAGRAAER